MDYKSTSAKLAEFRREIAAIRKKMREAQAGVEPEEVADYELANSRGTVRLSELVGAKTDLILIHNMGTACPNCTLWADGLNGIYHHLGDRAALVVSSPDPPEVQQRFAASRGWKFPMVSHQGTSFASDMGYRSKDGGWRLASPCSSAMATGFSACPMRRSNRAMTSARSGTSSIFCPRVSAIGHQSSSTRETDAA